MVPYYTVTALMPVHASAVRLGSQFTTEMINAMGTTGFYFNHDANKF